MKALIIAAVMLGTVNGRLPAQPNPPGSVMVPSLGGNVLVLGNSSQSWWGDPSCGTRAGRPADGGYPYWGYACDPFYSGNNVSDYQPPAVLIGIPVVASPVLPPPPAPAPAFRSQVHEYHWPASGNGAANFSIVSKDKRVQPATMVWVQDNALWYITPGGSEARIPLDSIDRQATRLRNAEKHLSFWLPGKD